MSITFVCSVAALNHLQSYSEYTVRYTRWVEALGRRTSLPVLYLIMHLSAPRCNFLCYPHTQYSVVVYPISIQLRRTITSIWKFGFLFVHLPQFVKYQNRCDFPETIPKHNWLWLLDSEKRSENVIFFPKCQRSRIWTEIAHTCVVGHRTEIPFRFLNQLFIKFIKKIICVSVVCVWLRLPHTQMQDEKMNNKNSLLSSVVPRSLCPFAQWRPERSGLSNIYCVA